MANETIIDPVCGMTVVPEKARAASPPRVAEHAGKNYYFCSAGCVRKFEAEPEKYLQTQAVTRPAAGLVQLGTSAKSAASKRAAAANIEYTCPMHPEIVQMGPGSCPICGMALEPKTVTAEPADDSELRSMTRRFWVSLAFTLPPIAIAMADLLPGMPLKHALGARTLVFLQLALATVPVLWGGWPFFERAAASLRTRHLNMFTLIG